MEFVSDHIRINLTDLARKVIESDRIIFGASANSNLTYGAIVNKIIENFDDDFTIDDSLLTLRNEDESRIVRLQNNVIDILGAVEIADYLKNTSTPNVPKYVKCLLESYSRLPFIKREKLILKKDVIQHIDAALKNRKNLQITYKGDTFIVTPICIAPAKEGTFQYLVGEKNSSRISIRLSRIEKIRAIGKTTPIAEDVIKQINADLSEFGPTFITEQKTTIKVKFSKKGLESYEYSVMHRPMHIAIEEDNVYVFCCSEMQAIYFFFRFAGDVEILEPLSLRNKFRDLYTAGLDKYI